MLVELYCFDVGFENWELVCCVSYDDKRACNALEM